MAGQELGSIEAAASMENWDKINDFISELIGQSIANASRGYKLRLASEELVSNIIRAAGELNSGEDKDISLQVSARLEQENGKSWFVVKTAIMVGILTHILVGAIPLIPSSISAKERLAAWGFSLLSSRLIRLPMTGLMNIISMSCG